MLVDGSQVWIDTADVLKAILGAAATPETDVWTAWVKKLDVAVSQSLQVGSLPTYATQLDAAQLQAASAALQELLPELEVRLAGDAFLAGSGIGAVDVIVASHLAVSYVSVCLPPVQFPHHARTH